MGAELAERAAEEDDVADEADAVAAAAGSGANAERERAPLLRPARFDWTLRALLAIALLFLIQHARTLLLPIVVAIVLTLMLAPAVRWLRRFGISDAIGAAIVVLLALTSVVGVAAVISGPAVAWWERAPSNLRQLENAVDRVRESIPFLAPKRTEPPVAKKGAAKAEPPPPDPVKERIASEGVSITRALALQTGTFVVSAAATVVLLYFLLASERWLVARTIQVIQRRRARALVLSAVRTAQREMAFYFGTQLLINVGVGLAVGLSCWWLGLEGAVLWGALTAILNFIPYLGPFVAGVLLAIAGVLNFDTFAQAVAPVTALIIIHAVEANIVSPIVMSRRLQLSPLALFLSVMLWGWLWGIAGALIAVPVLLTVRIVFHRVRSLRVWASYLDRTQEIDIPSLRALLRPPQTSVTRRLRRRSRETPRAVASVR